MRNKGYGSYREALLSKSRNAWKRAYEEELLRNLEKIERLNIMALPQNVGLVPFLTVLTVDPIVRTNVSFDETSRQHSCMVTSPTYLLWFFSWTMHRLMIKVWCPPVLFLVVE